MSDRVSEYLLDQIKEREQIIQSMMAAKAQDWDEGFTACANEWTRQAKDPSHPITRTNPHLTTEHGDLDGWVMSVGSTGPVPRTMRAPS